MNKEKITELEEKIKVRKKILVKKAQRLEALDKVLVRLIAQIEKLELKRRELNIKRQAIKDRITVHSKALRTLESYLHFLNKETIIDREVKEDET